MNHRLSASLLVRSSLALGLALAIWSPLRAQSAPPMDMMDMKTKMDGKMTASCQDMMAKRAKMTADMKAQDAELTAHVAQMNAASGAEKTKIMAAVITHMLELRITTDARKAKVEEEMMAHMMEHMQMGAASMTGCPMMKGMGDMDGKSTDAHKMHHDEEAK